MKTKEAIKFLDHMIGSFKCISSLNIKDINNKKNEIVSLLERGEKFEKMWEEVVRYLGEIHNNVHIAYSIKQKYLPKPIKKTITIEIEGEDDINLGFVTVMMKKAFDDIYCSPSMSFKLKEVIK